MERPRCDHSYRPQKMLPRTQSDLVVGKIFSLETRNVVADCFSHAGWPSPAAMIAIDACAPLTIEQIDRYCSGVLRHFYLLPGRYTGEGQSRQTARDRQAELVVGLQGYTTCPLHRRALAATNDLEQREAALTLPRPHSTSRGHT